MRDLQLIRRYELVFVLSTAVIYVIRRLIEEINRINAMVEIAESNRVPSSVVWRNLAIYNHTLNNNIPLIAGVCLVLGAWYIFHNLAYPLIQDRTNDQKAGIFIVLTIMLLLASTFAYHFLKLHVRYQYDTLDNIIGLKVFSLYRKRTVLADAIGLGIFLLAYQLLFQLFSYVHQNLVTELPEQQKRISYLPFVGMIATLISLALVLNLPPTLWQGGNRDMLMILGIGIQILFLQAYAYAYILPAFRAPRSSEVVLISTCLLFLFLAYLATTILWAAAAGFVMHSADPIIVTLSIVVPSALVIAYVRTIMSKEKVVLQTQVSAKSAELSSLQAQINPHFLFNALNSLYATALRENSEKTADGIQKLGDMMRFMLQENNRDRIPLDKEVEYLRNYIEIQRMRIDETHPIEIRVNIQEPKRAIYLAPMMLTPFVENAFKHGIRLRHPSWIYITLTLDETRLYFKVHNSRHLKQTETADRHDPEEDQSGVGLDNVRKRLDLIYPGRYQLDIQQSEQDYFVSLTLVYW
ncbi:sensor protein lytS [Spirosoma sp. HMF4905]|uniref:Sensor protein lytS n=1 Tax=Spirosoma arboris TaxID=2682092 RepID=A0A7K1SJ83_9BACT|nr:histidine kinase [Spirosoma arboris]MVM33794.1 sensor protein lytS [Spirosoma arboris]